MTVGFINPFVESLLFPLSFINNVNKYLHCGNALWPIHLGIVNEENMSCISTNKAGARFSADSFYIPPPEPNIHYWIMFFLLGLLISYVAYRFVYNKPKRPVRFLIISYLSFSALYFVYRLVILFFSYRIIS